MTEDSAVLNESYLVRLWRDSARSPWHATVHKVRSGEMTHFVYIEDMWAYLQAQMGDKHLQHPEPLRIGSQKREVPID